MILKNGMIFGEDAKFRRGNIVVSQGKFTDIQYGVCEGIPEEEVVIDATDYYVIPGMVDIHFHGCMGYDFCDGTQEAFDGIAMYQAQNGVTSMVPATMTLSENRLKKIFTAAGQYKNTTGSTMRGITMEGPFVSQVKRGAQNGAYIQKPDVDFYRQLQQLSGGKIRQVAIAPEEDETNSFIKQVSGETVVSVAHTCAGYEVAAKAFEAGATHVTHLLNAMPSFLHREPGVVGAAFDYKNVFVELICDGVHVHPAMVRAMFALFGAERICMISDSMMATGMGDGTYSLGEQKVSVKGKRAILADGTIAGSVSNLHDCLKMAVHGMGISLEEAILSCTGTPARSLGLEKECGSICVGRQADFVLLDKELNIQKVFIAGEYYAGIS